MDQFVLRIWLKSML